MMIMTLITMTMMITIAVAVTVAGVSNGLCEHCVYFCEHEHLSNFSYEQQAL